MYLRESRRTNEDGSVVAYLQQTGNSVAKVIHNFGRADQVDPAALDRLWERLGIGAAIWRAVAGRRRGRAGRHRPPAARRHQNAYLKSTRGTTTPNGTSA
jgi:hypothetical protein